MADRCAVWWLPLHGDARWRYLKMHACLCTAAHPEKHVGHAAALRQRLQEGVLELLPLAAVVAGCKQTRFGRRVIDERVPDQQYLMLRVCHNGLLASLPVQSPSTYVYRWPFPANVEDELCKVRSCQRSADKCSPRPHNLMTSWAFERPKSAGGGPTPKELAADQAGASATCQ